MLRGNEQPFYLEYLQKENNKNDTLSILNLYKLSHPLLMVPFHTFAD